MHAVQALQLLRTGNPKLHVSDLHQHVYVVENRAVCDCLQAFVKMPQWLPLKSVLRNVPLLCWELDELSPGEGRLPLRLRAGGTATACSAAALGSMRSPSDPLPLPGNASASNSMLLRGLSRSMTIVAPRGYAVIFSYAALLVVE
jgi:hypothetical protein